MKNLIFLLIAAVFTLAGCKKDNVQTELAAPDAEPVVPATLAEVDSLLKGRWKFVPLNYLPQNYKYSIAFYFRPYTKRLQIMKLTKTTLITVDLERLDYPTAPVVPADRQTVIHEFRRMSPMEESLFSPDISLTGLLHINTSCGSDNLRL